MSASPSPNPSLTFARIERLGVVPVVTVGDAAAGAGLCAALARGGLDVVEITLRTPAGLEVIESMADADGDILVGAGSVRDATEAEAAIAAGAAFLVSPGLDAGVLDVAAAAGVAAIPGIATATELMQARSRGASLVKLFPAEASGGVATLAALAAVFPDVRFMPTGGIGPQNAADYLALPSVVAVGGSWMVPPDLVAAHDWDAIAERAASALEIGAGRA